MSSGSPDTIRDLIIAAGSGYVAALDATYFRTAGESSTAQTISTTTFA